MKNMVSTHFVRGFFGNFDGYMNTGDSEIRVVNKGRLKGNMDAVRRDFQEYFKFQFITAKTDRRDEWEGALDSEDMKSLLFRNESATYCPVIKISAKKYNEGIVYNQGLQGFETYPFYLDIGNLCSVAMHNKLDFHNMVMGANYRANEIGADEYALVFPWLRQDDNGTECSPAAPSHELPDWFKFWTTNPEKREHFTAEWEKSLNNIVLSSRMTLVDILSGEPIGKISQFMGKGSR